jgi:hypothetical protein
MTAANWIALGSFAVGFLGILLGIFQRFSSRIETQTAKVAAELQGLRQNVTEDVRSLDERLRHVEANKVSHADWVRVSTSQLNRMNRLSEQLAEVSGKIDASIGMGGAVNRIASAIEKKLESEP